MKFDKEFKNGLIKDAELLIRVAKGDSHLGDKISCIRTTASILNLKIKNHLKPLYDKGIR